MSRPHSLHITDAVLFSGAGDETSTALLIKIPGLIGKVTRVVIKMPSGTVGTLLELAYADDSLTGTSLSDFDAMDPHIVRLKASGLAYAGTTNPAGPKWSAAAPEEPDADFVVNADFNTDSKKKHFINLRATGTGAAWTAEIVFHVEIHR